MYVFQVTPPTLIPDSEQPKELVVSTVSTDDLASSLEGRQDETESTPTQEAERSAFSDERTIEKGETTSSVDEVYSSPTDYDDQTVYAFTDYPTQISAIDETISVLPPIVGSDGLPLPTNAEGQSLNNLGNPVLRDEEGRPVGPSGEQLRKNSKGEYVYPVLGKDGKPLPTDTNLRPIYDLVGPDSRPFPKNDEGLSVDQYGNVIPTDSSGRPMSVDGSPYPTDEHGSFIVLKPEDSTPSTLPTDELGRPIQPVVYPDGKPLPTTESGMYIDEQGEIIPTNDDGLPVNQDGDVLERDSDGRFIYPGSYVLPTDSNGQPVRVIHMGKTLKSDESGRIIGPDGQIIPVNNEGHPVDMTHNVLPTTADGVFILPLTEARGTVAHERARGGKQVQVIDSDGNPLPVGNDGTVYDPYHNPIPTNEAGELVNLRNELLPTDRAGRVLFPFGGLDKPLVTDASGMPVYAVLGPDGKPLPTSDDGIALDPDGKPLPTNVVGFPVDDRGQPLPTDGNNNIIFVVKGHDSKTLPTDVNGRPVYPVIGMDGSLLPTDYVGAVLNEDGRFLPTNAAGVPVDEKGEPLPTDYQGYFQSPQRSEKATSSTAQPKYLVIGPNGQPLPRTSDGEILDPSGRPMPTNSAGFPVDSKGRPFVQDRKGNFIYPAHGIDSEPLPTDKSGKPVYFVIGPDSQLLSRDADGVVIDRHGRPIPTNAAGLPLDERGRYIQPDRNGYVIYPTQILATISPAVDRTDMSLYQVIGPDGEPLLKNLEGLVVDKFGTPVATDESGVPIDTRGRPLPRDRSGNYIYPATGLDAEPLPTDINGRPIYAVIGPDGNLLPHDDEGAVLGPDGRPLSTNAAGVPLDGERRPLPKDASGNLIYPSETSVEEAIYRVTHPSGAVLPSDFDIEGKAAPTDLQDSPSKDRGRPLSTDQSGNVIYPEKGLDSEILSSDGSQKEYLVLGPDGHPLPTDDGGRFLNPFGQLIPTNAAGSLVDHDGKPFPVDRNGTVYYPATKTETVALSTDRTGRPIYPVIGPDGQLLALDADGLTVDKDGKPIRVNAAGVPIDDFGSPLPTDRSGAFIILESTMTPMPTDTTGKKVYPVIGPNGDLLPRNADGAVVDLEGKPIATDETGLPVDNYGRSLPKDANGRYIYPAKGFETLPLPTDQSGKPVYPVIGPDGELMQRNYDGHVINTHGSPLPTNAAGVPIDRSGRPLSTEESGRFVYPTGGIDGELLPTDRGGRPVYFVLGPDGELLPQNAAGQVVDPYGNALPTNPSGVPIDKYGRPLPRDKSGIVIYPDEGFDSKYTTDVSGRPVYPVVGPDGEFLRQNTDGSNVDPHGRPLPTNTAGVPVNRYGRPLMKDANGNFIYPARGIDTQPLPTDSSGKPVYPVLGPDGHPLPRHSSGAVVGPNGQPLPTNEGGIPVDSLGKPLPRSENGWVIYPANGLNASPLPTDKSGRPVYPVIAPDGRLLPTDSSGHVIDPWGKPVPTNAAGFPVDNYGRLFPKDRSGNVIFPAKGLDSEPLPTDGSGKPIYPVVGSDGELLPTDEYGAYLGPNRKPIPTNVAGFPLNSDGEILPTDQDGNIVYSLPSEVISISTALPLVVIGPDGKPLPTSADGMFIGPDGRLIPTSRTGIPSNYRGQPLPKDKDGNIIYPRKGLRAELQPTDVNGRPVYTVLGPNGEPFLTNLDGAVVGPDGKPLPTNAAGVPVNDFGELLPTTLTGNAIYPARGLSVHLPPTDTGGRPIYNVIGPDGHLLPTTSDGGIIGPDGHPIPINVAGIPTNHYGQALPMDKEGNFIYPESGLFEMLPTADKSRESEYTVFGRASSPLPTTDSSKPESYTDHKEPDGVKPTSVSGAPIYRVIGPDGNFLPTDDLGQVLDPSGKPIPLDAAGMPVNYRGERLPVDRSGNVIFPANNLDAEALPTDINGRPVYAVVGSGGELMPTNEKGVAIDRRGKPLPTNAAGVPVDKHGKPLPVDSNGNIVFPEELGTRTTYRVIGPDGERMLPSEDGILIGLDGKPVPTNEAGLPVGEHGESLPRDREGNLIILAPGFGDRVLPTDELGRPVYPVVGPDGKLLATNEKGAHVDKDGKPIPTNRGGVPLDARGEQLTRDGDGHFIYRSEEQSLGTSDVSRPVGADSSPLPTDETGRIVHLTSESLPTYTTNEYGHIIYPIVNADGVLMKKDENGFFITHDGGTIGLNEHSIPLGPDGRILPTDSAGNYIYPENTAGVMLPMDSLDRTPHSYIGPYSRPSPTVRDDSERQGAPTDIYGPSSLSSTDSSGFIYYGARTTPAGESTQHLSSTDMYGGHLTEESESSATQRTAGIAELFDPDGKTLPTDERGEYVHSKTRPDSELLSTESDHRPSFPVISPDDDLLPTGEHISTLDADKLKTTDGEGHLLDTYGDVRATDHAVIPEKLKPCHTKDGVMDVVVAISAGSLNDRSFLHIKKVLNDLINEHFDLAPDVTQFAIIKYSGTAEVPVTLGGYDEKMELLNDLAQVDKGSANDLSRISVGVNAAKQQFITFGRSGVGKLLLIITDGQDMLVFMCIWHLI